MKIPRNITAPIMLLLVVISTLIAALSFFTAESEFHQFDHVGRLMPVFAMKFRAVYGFAWLIPLITTIVSIWALRQPERPAAQFAWTASFIIIANCAWATFSFTALYVLHLTYL